MLAPGSTVVVRDEDWLVTAVEPASDGQFVHVVGLSELVRDTEAVFSTELDTVTEFDPATAVVEADDSAGYRRTRLWLESVLRKTPVPIAEQSLATAHRGLADALTYQVKAVQQALDPDNLRPRILLADAVGLGKTIEIGMILAELVRRGRGDRILVVTPKHVLEQMQMELWTRFALPFVRLDSTGIARIRQELPANRNPFTYYKRVIISIDTLKSDRYLNHLRKQRWDAVVIDESHNVTNSFTQNNRLARLLASRTDALILASATPHNGRKESFAELVRMLEPSAVTPDGEIDKAAVRKLIIRRHRHSPDVASEVGADWAERLEPRNILVPASAAENAVAVELNDTWLHPVSGRAPYTGTKLFQWTLAKAFLSSPAALAETIANRLKQSSDPVEVEALNRLAALNDVDTSAKYDALVKHLRGVDGRAVIFSERVPTLEWLAAKLRKDFRLKDENVVVLHGRLSDDEQQRIVESFKLASSPIKYLVTGDVASEGVNLHSQCHHLVHFDIPWSLIRIEQRNGRIDRYGQKYRPDITTLLLEPATAEFAGDIKVLTRLIEREHEAHTVLGESSSLIGTYDVAAEEEKIKQVLARRQSIDDVVRTVSDVQDDDGIDGFLASLLALDAEPEPEVQAQHTTVYEHEIDFLADALLEATETPGQAPPNGVSWVRRDEHSIASLIPPVDLVERLKLLPQSYLKSRRVVEHFQLAFSTHRGEQELRQAREGSSTSAWPEAHYLAPLHPLIDWACDRVLAQLGRGQVYAVSGSVFAPTVLVQGMLTNKAGQVVATAYINVTEFGAQPMESAAAAVAALGIPTVNARPVVDPGQYQPLVARAVRAAQAVVEQQVAAIEGETRERIERWVTRSQRWDAAARELAQRQSVREQRSRIDEEVRLADAMNPARTLVRPLLVVVPGV